MDYLLIILSLILAFIGVLGAVIPALPGPPVSFIGLLLLFFCNGCDISTTALVVTGLLAIAVTIFDYVAPPWFAKRFGGTTAGIWGATLGLLVGFFFALPGILLGPFIGAFLGEIYAKTPAEKALGVAFMSFVAFIFTTGLKLFYGIAVLVVIVKECFGILFP